MTLAKLNPIERYEKCRNLFFKNVGMTKDEILKKHDEKCRAIALKCCELYREAIFYTIRRDDDDEQPTLF